MHTKCMKTQNQIKRTLSNESSLLYLKDLLNSKKYSSQVELVKEICYKFNFYDHLGQIQIAGCAKALRSLDLSGHIILPVSKKKAAITKSPQRLMSPLPIVADMPSTVNEIQELELILVNSDAQKQLWNELMIQDHPLGSGIFVGRQLRYLIHSCHGYLGGIGFASPALQLSDRDNWIGWDSEQRQSHLHSIVGMSRFLIRKGIKCHNLASKILSMSIPVMVTDFESRYGYKPLLMESFVDEKYNGTCYQAACG